jgi:hypothetical protein
MELVTFGLVGLSVLLPVLLLRRSPWKSTLGLVERLCVSASHLANSSHWFAAMRRASAMRSEAAFEA